MKYGKNLLALLLAVLLLAGTAGCGSGGTQTTQTTAAATAGQAAETVQATAPPVVLDVSGLTPVYPGELKDGVYPIAVDSSSTMFKIVSCDLVVEGGDMTAVMTMGGTGYLYLYMGTGEAAAAAQEADYIPFVEGESGAHTFTVPVEALNQEIPCAAFSKNRQSWYDRTLVFRADQIAPTAFVDGDVVTAQSLGLADGIYTANVSLEGGSSRSEIASPTQLRVEGGQAYVTLVWNSADFDYVKIGGETYLAEVVEGQSQVEVPVDCFDDALAIRVDTTAMGTPHEIALTLYVSSQGLT